jgi:hypothetical protein
MKRFVCILAIPAVVCAILLLNLVTFKVGMGTAHACGSSAIKGSSTEVRDKTTNATISFSLWYNSCNQQNFTSANITSGSIKLFVDVCRNPGPDGGALCEDNTVCPTTGICNSPGVYSPNNTSYSVIDSGYETVVTSSF